MHLFCSLLYTALFSLLALLTAPLWLWRYLTTEKYRKWVGERFGYLPEAMRRSLRRHPCFWVHAVSVGEALAAQGLIEELHRLHPTLRVVVSTVTRTGRLVVHQKLSCVDHLFYLPLDLPWVVERTVASVCPEFFVVMETELWPSLFRALERRRIPVMVVNGRLSPRSFHRYRRVAWCMRHFLRPVHLCAMQSQEDLERIRVLLGSDSDSDRRIRVTGNIKYDQALRLPGVDGMAALEERLGARGEGLIWMAASTHSGEESVIIPLFQKIQHQFPGLRLLLAPRHPERATEIAGMLRQSGAAYTTLSMAGGRWQNAILLVDEVGWLMRLYGWADVAFVGGSLIPHGGQNPLEPAAWGRPVLFGEYMFNFKEIAEALQRSGGAVRVESEKAFQKTLCALLEDSDRRQEMGNSGRAVVRSNVGALKRTISAIQSVIAGEGDQGDQDDP